MPFLTDVILLCFVVSSNKVEPRDHDRSVSWLRKKEHQLELKSLLCLAFLLVADMK